MGISGSAALAPSSFAYRSMSPLMCTFLQEADLTSSPNDLPRRRTPASSLCWRASSWGERRGVSWEAYVGLLPPLTVPHPPPPPLPPPHPPSVGLSPPLA